MTYKIIGRRHLEWLDYLLFSLVLMVSAGIGIFYGCFGKKQKTTKDILVANREMGTLPVALSLLASFMSAITLLGTPSEIYVYGSIYMWIGLSYISVILVSNLVFIPVFYKLGVTTSYEYLGMRFHKVNQIIGAVVFIVQMVIYLGIVLYAPSLALNAVTGFNVWIAVFSVGIVCTFYTTIGGIKAVVWTDVFQVTLMFVGFVAILARGSQLHGGFGHVWNINEKGGRIETWNFDPTPTTRHTFWTQTIGATFTWCGIYSINQAMVQRAMTVSTLAKAKMAYWINLPGLVLLMVVCSFAGLIIYDTYADCDPIKSGMVSANDQLLPLFVMEHLTHIPGLAGLFTACLFSGALSTVSSGVNSLAAVTLLDIIMVKKPDLSDRTAARLTKGLAIMYGAISLAAAYLASHMGQILQAALALFGMLSGPLLGVFTLGIVFPMANWKGATIGHFVSQVFIFWIGFGYYIYGVKAPRLPIDTSGCDAMYGAQFNSSLLNSTASPLLTTLAPNMTIPHTDDPQSNIPSIYKLSYMWYSGVSFFICVIVGLIASAITGFNKISDVDPRLIQPLCDALCCCCPGSLRKRLRFNVDHTDKWKRPPIRAVIAAQRNKLTQKQNYVNAAYVNSAQELPNINDTVHPISMRYYISEV